MDKSCGEKCERARKEGLFLRKNEASTYRSYVLASFFVRCARCWVVLLGDRWAFFEPCAERGGLPNLRAPPIDLHTPPIDLPTPLIASIGDFFEPLPVQTAGRLVGEGCSRKGSAPCCGAPPLCFGERLTYRGARCEK